MADQTDESMTVETSTQRPSKKCGGMFFCIGLFIILMGVMGGGYFKLNQTNLALAAKITDLQQQNSNTQNTTDTLQKNMTDLEKINEKSQQLSQQQEKILNDWQSAQKGNLDKWYIAEAQYLVKLANDHLQFSHNVALAKTLLERALSVLDNLQDPNLLELRKSLTADIANMQAINSIDITALYLQLTASDQQIDQLPLPFNPLKDETKSHSITSSASAPWWKVGFDRTLEALSKIVIVRYNAANALPLVLPEEKAFLYQNLHAQMENALWAVLHQNATVYQASLGRATAFVQKYFDQQSSITKNQLQNLQTLMKVNIEPPTINLANSLSLFDQFFTKTDSTH